MSTSNNIFQNLENLLFTLFFIFLPLSTFKLLRIDIAFFKLPISVLFLGLILILKIIYLLTHQKILIFDFHYNRNFLLFMGCLLLMLIVNIYPYIFNNVDITWAIKSIVRLGISFVVFFIVSYFMPKSENFIDNCISVFILSSTFFISLIIFKHISYSIPFLSATWDISSREGITKAGKNSLGFYLSVTSSIIFWKYVSIKKHISIWIIPLIIHLFAMVYAQSRSSWLAFLVSLISVILIFRNKIKYSDISHYSYLRPVLFIFIISLFSFHYFVNDNIKEALKVRSKLMSTLAQGNISNTDRSARERVTMIKKSLKIIEGNPIIGVGTNLYPYTDAGDEFSDVLGKVSHNDYITIFSEQGFLGFCFLLLMLYQLLKLMFFTKVIKWKNIALSQAVIVILFQMLFLDPLYFSFSYVIFGLFFSIFKINGNNLKLYKIRL